MDESKSKRNFALKIRNRIVTVVVQISYSFYFRYLCVEARRPFLIYDVSISDSR